MPTVEQDRPNAIFLALPASCARSRADPLLRWHQKIEHRLLLCRMSATGAEFDHHRCAYQPSATENRSYPWSSPRSASRRIASGLEICPSCLSRHRSTRLRNWSWQRTPTSMPIPVVGGRPRLRFARLRILRFAMKLLITKSDCACKSGLMCGLGCRSRARVRQALADVRFTPVSDRRADIRNRQLRAISEV
jgi:hypothetical protein